MHPPPTLDADRPRVHVAASLSDRAARWYRPTMVGLTVVIGALAAALLAETLRSSWARDWAFGNGDLLGYLDGARRFVDTGNPYLPDQIHGPWALQPRSFIHPPSALLLMVPFLWLPAVLWWIIPLAGTGLLVGTWRPAVWAWPLIALCLAWPRSQGSILVGNSDLWAMLIVALGCAYGWPFALLIIKPTFAPLGLVGSPKLRTWIGGAFVAITMVPLIGLWWDYIAVVRNSNIDPRYSLLNLPLVIMPVIAWSARRRMGDKRPPIGQTDGSRA